MSESDDTSSEDRTASPKRSGVLFAASARSEGEVFSAPAVEVAPATLLQVHPVVWVAERWVLVDAQGQDLPERFECVVIAPPEEDAPVAYLGTKFYERCVDREVQAVAEFLKWLFVACVVRQGRPLRQREVRLDEVRREVVGERCRNATLIEDKLRVVMGGDHVTHSARSNGETLDLEFSVFDAALRFGYDAFSLDGARSRLGSLGIDVPRWGHNKNTERLADFLGVSVVDLVGDRQRSEPEVDIPSTPRLPELRPYQTRIVEPLVEILAGRSERRRVMVSLPTGAGKTRVAVEAIVRSLSAQDEPRPVVWIAQSRELLEQATATFDDAWRALGDAGRARPRPLRVSKIYDGMRPSLNLDDPTRPHVVVASIQSVHGRVKGGNAGWLRDVGALVIDEAHHAIARTYTETLRELSEVRTVPVIGLTATPMRGTNDDDTRRLIDLFGRYLLPDESDSECRFDSLIGSGVLSRHAVEPLGYAPDFGLTPKQQKSLDQFHAIPDDVLRRLGRVPAYNELIANRVLALPPNARTLVFCCTVEQAHTVASIISEGFRDRGSDQRAARVVGETPRAERARRLAAFRDGAISVLTTVDVLTTGFDAPKVDTVVVARPTLSPVLYLQMVGRGLRGPASGGTEHCLIINAIENIDRWGIGELPYQAALDAWR